MDEHIQAGINPFAANIKAILSSVGVEEDATSLKPVLEQLKGKDDEELMTQGMRKQGPMPAASAVPPAGGAAPAAGGSAPAKEEKKEEPEEESDDNMGMGLFD